MQNKKTINWISFMWYTFRRQKKSL